MAEFGYTPGRRPRPESGDALVFSERRPSGVLPTARVVDHEHPGSVGLAPHHLGASTRHRHRLAVGVSAADAPLCLRQRDITVRALDPGHLDAELWLQRQETLHFFADCRMAGDHLSGFLDE